MRLSDTPQIAVVGSVTHTHVIRTDRSILSRAVSHKCVSTEFGKSKLKLGVLDAVNGFHSSISALVREKHF